jgi:NAD(P)-dependent dehydrogenase (short-subunit alcohol dehydrogenase family)
MKQLRGDDMAKKTKAVVIGVGAERGVGGALSRRFAKEGYHVLVAGRTAAKIGNVAETIRAAGGTATPVVTDGTKEADIAALFDKAMTDDADGVPADLFVFNMGNNAAVDFREMTAEHFEDSWRVGCFAGFLFGREAMRRLAPLGRGTVVFTGASGSMRGRPRFAAFNATKGGLRLLVQSMAREFGPQGIHVAHVIIDGGIEGDRLLSRMPGRAEQVGPDGLLKVDAIVDNYWHLHRQQRSAWSHEIDLRPFKETF